MVHKKLKKKHKNLLTIIIPRHIDRSENIIKKIEYAIEQHPSFLKVLSEKQLLEIEQENKSREW